MEFLEDSDDDGRVEVSTMTFSESQVPILASALGVPLDEEERRRFFQSLASAPTSSLENEKRRVKTALRKFDEEFTARFGREPKRSEKEPLRPLYDFYRDVKSLLAVAASRNRSDAARVEGKSGYCIQTAGYASKMSFGAFSAASSSSRMLDRHFHWNQSASASREAKKTPAQADADKLQLRL